MKARVKETGEVIDVYQEVYPIYRNKDYIDPFEYDDEDLEFLSNKKRYIIEFSADGYGYGYSDKYLTDSEYKLLTSIIDDSKNETVRIIHIPDNDKLYDKIGLNDKDINITVIEITDLLIQYNNDYGYIISAKIAEELKQMKLERG